MKCSEKLPCSGRGQALFISTNEMLGEKEKQALAKTEAEARPGIELVDRIRFSAQSLLRDTVHQSHQP